MGETNFFLAHWYTSEGWEKFYPWNCFENNFHKVNDTLAFYVIIIIIIIFVIIIMYYRKKRYDGR